MYTVHMYMSYPNRWEIDLHVIHMKNVTTFHQLYSGSAEEVWGLSAWDQCEQRALLCCQHTGQEARGGGTLGHCYSSSKTLSGQRCMGLLLSLLFGLDDISLTGAGAVLGYTKKLVAEGRTLGHCSPCLPVSLQRFWTPLQLTFGMRKEAASGTQCTCHTQIWARTRKAVCGWGGSTLIVIMHQRESPTQCYTTKSRKCNPKRTASAPVTTHSFPCSSSDLSMTGALCATCSFFPHFKGQPRCPPTPNLVSWISCTSQESRVRTMELGHCYSSSKTLSGERYMGLLVSIVLFCL